MQKQSEPREIHVRI